MLQLAPEALNQTLRDYLRPIISDREPADVDLRRHLSCLPVGAGVLLSQVKALLERLHPDALALLINEHQHAMPDATVFQATPWVLDPMTTGCIVSPRPAYTVDAVRFSLNDSSRGFVRALVLGAGSWRELAVWDRESLVERGQPLRVGVQNGTVSSCLHLLAFDTIGGEALVDLRAHYWVPTDS